MPKCNYVKNSLVSLVKNGDKCYIAPLTKYITSRPVRPFNARSQSIPQERAHRASPPLSVSKEYIWIPSPYLQDPLWKRYWRLGQPIYAVSPTLVKCKYNLQK
jgi:hypothetical protein